MPGTVGFAVAIADIAGDAPPPRGMIGVVGVRQREAFGDAELGLNQVQPGRVRRGEHGHDPQLAQELQEAHPPPLPRGTRGPRRRAEPPIDAGPREPRCVEVRRGASRCVTCPTPARRRPDRPVSTAPVTPRDHAGTFGVRGRPTAASPRAPPAPGHSPGPQAERPARHTGAVVGAPSPAHRCSRGRGRGLHSAHPD